MHSDNEVVYLHLDDIIPNRFQPREVFDDRALKELAISIKEHGVIQPIIVRNIGNKYEIIAGERRYKASALAGLTKIPAIVRNLDDKESSKVALLENLQRKNLNPVEEARTYQKILELDQMTQEELAKTMGKSQSAVANKLRLLALTEDVQQALLKEQISERHARTLLNFENPEEQKDMLNKVIESRMTVRELEQEVKKEEIRNEDLVPNKDIENSKDIKMPNLRIPNDDIQLGHSFAEEIERPKLMDSIDGNPNYMKNDVFAQSKPMDIPKEKPEELPKFINYGEIDPDEDDDDEEEGFSFGTSSAASPVDIAALKSNTKDINETMNDAAKNIADLDSLLKISPVPISEDEGDEEEEVQPSFKFFSPLDTDTKPSSKSNSKKTDHDAAEINSFFENIPGNNRNLTSYNERKPSYEDRPITIKDAINSIRDQIKQLERQGLQVDSDEIDFENSYQIVIKINKNN